MPRIDEGGAGIRRIRQVTGLQGPTTFLRGGPGYPSPVQIRTGRTPGPISAPWNVLGGGFVGPDPGVGRSPYAWLLNPFRDVGGGGVPPPPPPGDGGGDGGGGAPTPPWAVNLQFPSSPFRQWFQQNVPWYNPLAGLSEGQVAGLDQETANQLLVLNALLPFLGQEDVGSMARFLAMATGGGTGPFAGYLQVPPVGSPVRQQVGEQRRLEDALAVARLMSEPGARALAEGTLGLGISGLGAGARPDGALGPQDIVARSRENWMRFQQGLAGLGGTTGPGAAISPFLQRLALPSQLRPLPGQLTRTDGGFQVAPNLRWLVG